MSDFLHIFFMCCNFVVVIRWRKIVEGQVASSTEAAAASAAAAAAAEVVLDGGLLLCLPLLNALLYRHKKLKNREAVTICHAFHFFFMCVGAGLHIFCETVNQFSGAQFLTCFRQRDRSTCKSIQTKQNSTFNFSLNLH